MPATGIEPVLYFYNRILSPARLPVPPRRHNYIQFTEHNLMGGGGFEPPKQFAADLQSVPFGHSGIHPFVCSIVLTRTDYNTAFSIVQELFIQVKKECWQASLPHSFYVFSSAYSSIRLSGLFQCRLGMTLFLLMMYLL